MLKKSNHPHEDSLGLERIVFFSDAVMAIAITLLAIDIRVPEINPSVAATELPAQLTAITPNLLTFFISFIVIGIYWISHHRYLGYIKRYDTRLMLLNLIFLFFIACMPFVASLLGRFSPVPIALIIYTLAVAALGFSMALIWLYASKNHRLIEASLDAGTIRTINIRLFIAPLMFVVAVPFAYVSPTAVIIVWWLSPLAVVLTSRILTKKRTKQHPR
jgi:uncharacterized membrane protein